MCVLDSKRLKKIKMYRVVTHLYSDIVVFKENEEIFRMTRSNHFAITKCEVFTEDILILKFNYFSFLCFTKIKLYYQNLPKTISIKKDICNNFILFKNKKIRIKFSLIPFGKNFGNIFYDNKLTGRIKHRTIGLPDEIKVYFNSKNNSEIEKYSLLLLLIKLVHIDSE